jgi:hypothetical protein
MKSCAISASVVPAKAGTQYSAAYREVTAYWVPALAMLGRDDRLRGIRQ